MIDSHLILNNFDRDHQRVIADALDTLHQSGIFLAQVKANSSRLAEGFQEREPEELTKEIMQVQQTNRYLLALHEWAGNFKKEIKT